MIIRIIATLAIVGAVSMSSPGTADAGVLFNAVRSVGKKIVNKAVAVTQGRQQRSSRQRAPVQPTAQAVQSPQASGAATKHAPAGSEL